jgi:hypothetical protein
MYATTELPEANLYNAQSHARQSMQHVYLKAISVWRGAVIIDSERLKIGQKSKPQEMIGL